MNSVTCRRCSDCKDRSHHWIENGLLFICKHCATRGDLCDLCDGTGGDDGTCPHCRGEAVVARPFELEWRHEVDACQIRAGHPFYVDGEAPLYYVLEDDGDEWTATFEGRYIAGGRLQDCMAECEQSARDDIERREWEESPDSKIPPCPVCGWPTAHTEVCPSCQQKANTNA